MWPKLKCRCQGKLKRLAYDAIMSLLSSSSTSDSANPNHLSSSLDTLQEGLMVGLSKADFQKDQ